MIRSKLERKLELLLKEILPYYDIYNEYYVKVNGQQLFFDFYIPDLKLSIEVQGKQHYSFCKFFHNTFSNYTKQRARHRTKVAWCEENGIELLVIPYNKVSKLTKAKLKSYIVRGSVYD